MKFYKNILFVLVCMCFMSVVSAENVVVIVNAENNQAINSGDIKGIYSDNVIQWSNGSPIKSYDLPVKEEAREIFSQHILGTSARGAAKDWANRKITNTAKNPPKTSKEKSIVASVKKEVNAIAYVSESAVEGQAGIKVLMVIK